jgi:hypothetical protein
MQDDFAAMFRDSLLPSLKQERGFKGALLLSDANMGTEIAITLWDTEQDMWASESTYFKGRLPMIMDLLARPPVMHTYEVSAQA